MKYYNVKCRTTIVDEAAGKEKNVGVQYLVNAEDATEAASKTEKFTEGTMYPTVIIAVAETKIQEVIE